jgi:hypothetical protein
MRYAKPRRTLVEAMCTPLEYISAQNMMMMMMMMMMLQTLLSCWGAPHTDISQELPYRLADIDFRGGLHEHILVIQIDLPVKDTPLQCNLISIYRKLDVLLPILSLTCPTTASCNKDSRRFSCQKSKFLNIRQYRHLPVSDFSQNY